MTREIGFHLLDRYHQRMIAFGARPQFVAGPTPKTRVIGRETTGMRTQQPFLAAR